METLPSSFPSTVEPGEVPSDNLDPVPDQGSGSSGGGGATDSSGNGGGSGSGSGNPNSGGNVGSTLAPAFLMVGHVQSSMYSCDGGQTWRGYQTADSQIRCWDQNSGNYDCDHQSTASRGLAYGNKGFIATFGWGHPGHVSLTENGNTWTQVHSGATWAGTAFGNGTYLLNDRSPLISSDGGQNWSAAGSLNFIPDNAREIEFINQGSGFFVSMAQTRNVTDLLISRDNGVSFSRPQALPTDCGNGNIAHDGQSTILLDSVAFCRSQDQGRSWEVLSNRPEGGYLVYADGAFKIFAPGVVFSSTDGTSWSGTPLNLQGGQGILRLSKVAYHPATHKYVAFSQGWQTWYEHTRYYHSSDGVNWLELNKAQGDAPLSPHPIRYLKFGYLKECAP